MIEQLPAEYVYTEMFKALDMSDKGVISLDDLHMAAQSIGWSKKQIVDLISDLDPNHEDSVNAQEFMLMMKYIEQKKETKLPNISSKRSINASPSNASSRNLNTSFAGSDNQSDTYAQDKKKYGALLPKSGVYFLPDDRVVCFLKVAEECRKRCEAKSDYNNAFKYKDVIKVWR